MSYDLIINKTENYDEFCNFFIKKMNKFKKIKCSKIESSDDSGLIKI